MNLKLSNSEEAAYQALVLVAKEMAQPEADRIRNNYITTETERLVESQGVTVEDATKFVQIRCNGALSMKDIVHFQGGEVATVEDILSNPSLYNGRPCADPLEPNEGTSRTMFFANKATNNPVIHSFLHGGQIYHLGDNFKNDKEEAQTIKDLLELADLLEAGDIEGMKEVLQSASELDEIEMQELLRRIKKRTGMTLGAMRSFLNGGTGSSSDDLDHLDIAKKLVDQFGRENVLSVENGVFTWRQCGVWKMIEKGELQHRAQRVIEEERKVMSSWVDGVVKVFTNEIYKPNHKFNIGNPEVVNCRNGELHLNKDAGEWELKPHDREAYRTSQIPVKYDANATAPRFEQFLKEIFEGDEDRKDKKNALLEMIGYTMMAHCLYEQFIILIGVGANGKSVLLSVLEELVGRENTVGVQPSQFNNRFQRAHLQHKLANIVTEIKQGEVIADAELKGIVSGEPSTVENKFKDPFTMRPYATCWFATNHMPHTRDFSEALFRRALIIKFNRVFTDAEKNPQLRDLLIAELPGILNLALNNYAWAVQMGFTKPASSEVAKEEWRLEAGQVQQFVNDCCNTYQHQDMMIKSQILYNGYRRWADENGIYRTLTMKSFRDRLSRLGYGAKRKKDGWYVTNLERGANFPSI